MLVRRIIWSLWFRTAVVLALLALIASRVDWTRAIDRLRQGNFEWFVVAIFALALALVIGGVRWWVLVRRYRGATGRRVGRAYAVGVFTNAFLPTSFGGDVARAWLLSRSGNIPLPRTAASVLVDRMLGFAGVFVVGWLFVLSSIHAVPSALLLTLTWTTAAALLVFVLLIAATQDRSGRLRRIVPARAQPTLRDARDALRGYLADFPGFVVAALLSLAYQALVVTEMTLLARALNVDVPAAVFGAVLPLVLVATMVPFSVGGLGIREGALVILLSRAGLDTTDATLISALSLAALTLATAPCGVALLGQDLRPRDERSVAWSKPLV